MNAGVMLWPPSSTQSAALSERFQPLNYSRFVLRSVINHAHHSYQLFMYIILNIMIQTFFLFVFRFWPFVLLQHVEDTMVTSRLKWTVQTGNRATAASTSSLAIRSGKVVAWHVFCRWSSFISFCIHQRYCVKQMPKIKSSPHHFCIWSLIYDFIPTKYWWIVHFLKSNYLFKSVI